MQILSRIMSGDFIAIMCFVGLTFLMSNIYQKRIRLFLASDDPNTSRQAQVQLIELLAVRLGVTGSMLVACFLAVKMFFIDVR